MPNDDEIRDKTGELARIIEKYLATNEEVLEAVDWFRQNKMQAVASLEINILGERAQAKEGEEAFDDEFLKSLRISKQNQN